MDCSSLKYRLRPSTFLFFCTSLTDGVLFKLDFFSRDVACPFEAANGRGGWAKNLLIKWTLLFKRVFMLKELFNFYGERESFIMETFISRNAIILFIASTSSMEGNGCYRWNSFEISSNEGQFFTPLTLIAFYLLAQTHALCKCCC